MTVDAAVVRCELVILAALLREPELTDAMTAEERHELDLFEAADIRRAAVMLYRTGMVAIALSELGPQRERLYQALEEMNLAGDKTDSRRLTKLLQKHADIRAMPRTETRP